MVRQFFSRCFLTVTLVALSAGISSAAIVSGDLNFAGTAVVTIDGLDFIPPSGGDVGTILTLSGGTGTFAGLPLGSLGTITDRTESEQPVGETLSIPNYLTLSALPNLVFTLEFIAPGSFTSGDCFAPAANGQTCTLPPSPTGALSPYNFNNYIDATAGLSSQASFSVRGTVYDITTPDLVSTFNGVFTATFLGTPFQENLETVLNGGSVIAPFSASFEAAIPEPSSFLLVVSAGLLAFGIRRRNAA